MKKSMGSALCFFSFSLLAQEVNNSEFNYFRFDLQSHFGSSEFPKTEADNFTKTVKTEVEKKEAEYHDKKEAIEAAYKEREAATKQETHPFVSSTLLVYKFIFDKEIAKLNAQNKKVQDYYNEKQKRLKIIHQSSVFVAACVKKDLKNQGISFDEWSQNGFKWYGHRSCLIDRSLNNINENTLKDALEEALSTEALTEEDLEKKEKIKILIGTLSWQIEVEASHMGLFDELWWKLGY